MRGANEPTWTWLQLVAFATMTLPKEPEDYVTGWSKSNPREEEYQASCDVFSVEQAVTAERTNGGHLTELSEKSSAWNASFDESDGLIRRTASPSSRLSCFFCHPAVVVTACEA